jgi:hypothetical protein
VVVWVNPSYYNAGRAWQIFAIVLLSILQDRAGVIAAVLSYIPCTHHGSPQSALGDGCCVLATALLIGSMPVAAGVVATAIVVAVSILVAASAIATGVTEVRAVPGLW